MRKDVLKFTGGSRLAEAECAAYTFEAIEKLLTLSPRSCISTIRIVLFDRKFDAAYKVELGKFKTSQSGELPRCCCSMTTFFCVWLNVEVKLLGNMLAVFKGLKPRS